MRVSFEIGGRTVILGGMAKGSGMIHPDMGTMLAFITTDLSVSKELLQKALSEVVQDTFNMISVDGDTSTNDTLVVMANGEAGNPEVSSEEDYRLFKENRVVDNISCHSVSAENYLFTCFKCLLVSHKVNFVA